MAVVGALVRAELRRSRRGLVLLVLLTAVVGTVVFAAAAGARRTSSAFERFGAETRMADAEIQINDGPFDCGDPGAADRFDWITRRQARAEHVRGLTGVEDTSVLAGSAVRPRGTDDQPALDLVGVAPVDAASDESVDRLLLTEGRLPRSDRADEALLNEAAADRYGYGVGDEIVLESVSPGGIVEAACGFQGSFGELDGPTATVTVVGIGRGRRDITTSESSGAVVRLAPAFFSRYGNDIGGFEILNVRLEPGHGISDLRAQLEEEYGGEPGMVNVDDVDQLGARELEDAVTLQAVALTIFALVAGAAGTVALAQALARRLARPEPEGTALRSIGCSTPQRAVAAGVGAAVVAAAGGTIAAVGAWLVSPVFPTGLAGRAEPSRGFDLDPWVLGLGAAVLVLLSFVLGAAHEARATLRAKRYDNARSTRRSLVASALARSGFPSPAVTGARFALDRGAGNPVPVRSAVSGAVVAVSGVVAAVVFASSLEHLQDSPELYGWGFELEAGGSDDPAEAAGIADQFAGEPAVDAVALVRVAPTTTVGGRRMQALGITPVQGSTEPTILDGRAPRAPDEILLGADTVDDLGADIGDTVTPSGASDDPARFRVVGLGLLPTIDSERYTEGAVLTGDGLDRIVPEGGFNAVAVSFADDADVEAELARLEEEGRGGFPASPPSEVANLRQVDEMPRYLMVFLSLLGIAALANALVMTVQRRGRDLGVLRTLGFRRRQVAACIVTEALTVAAVGTVIGTVLGVVVGRFVWFAQAQSLDVRPVAIVSPLAVGIVALATVAVAVIAALLPARRAAKLDVTSALRQD